MSKLRTPFTIIFYPIFISLFIYFGFVKKNCGFDSLYDNLILNDNEDYLRNFIYNDYNGNPPILSLDKFLIKKNDKYIKDIKSIKKECPMTTKDVSDELLNLLEDDEQNNSNNSEDEKIEKKKQKVIENFINNIDNSICGCLKVQERVFITSYLCKTIGFSFLMNTDVIDNRLSKNSKNLFMGQVNYDASKSLIKFIFKLIQGLTIFNITKIWIMILTYSILYYTISKDTKTKKTKDLDGKKEIYFDSAKNGNVPINLFFYGLFLSFLYSLIPTVITVVSSLQFGKLGNLRNIINTSMFKKVYLYILFFLIFNLLIGGLSSSFDNLASVAKKGFNSKDSEFIDIIKKSFSFNLPKNTVSNSSFYIFQSIILCILIFSICYAFKPSFIYVFILFFIIYLTSLYIHFQFKEGNFNDIFKKCTINNANPYSFTDKLVNEPFWNITSGYIKYNYNNF